MAFSFSEEVIRLIRINSFQLPVKVMIARVTETGAHQADNPGKNTDKAFANRSLLLLPAVKFRNTLLKIGAQIDSHGQTSAIWNQHRPPCIVDSRCAHHQKSGINIDCMVSRIPTIKMPCKSLIRSWFFRFTKRKPTMLDKTTTRQRPSQKYI